jgi:hypothetical protein
MTRKELIRAYKETRRPMGVYRVHNTRHDRSIIGRSVDLPSILNRERAALRLGAHRNEALQRDWNELGPDAFTFEILDTITPPEGQPSYDPADDLEVLEAMWVERLGATGERSYAPRRAPRP